MKAPVLFSLLVVGMAQATTINPLSFEDQIKKADVILHVRITDVKTVQDRNNPWQQYTLKVQETLKGDAKSLLQVQDQPTIRVLGGNNLQMEGAPSFKKDEEWILMLYKTPYDSPVVGFNQGMYRVQDNRVLAIENLNLKNNELATFKTTIREKL